MRASVCELPGDWTENPAGVQLVHEKYYLPDEAGMAQLC
jgi:hypothetical protein